MKLYLKKISNDIGDLEYMMYQELPASENGAINNLKGATLVDYYVLIKDRILEEFIELDQKNTPRITFIMYDDNYPIGEVMIRPVLNDYWKKYSGNIGYKIRPSKRSKGCGNIILRLALEECKKLNLNKVYLQCMKNNICSNKVILKNDGKLVNEDESTLYYKIEL